MELMDRANSLELDHLSLSLLITSQLEMFATSQWSLFAVFAVSAFHTQHNLLGGLGLKVDKKDVINKMTLEEAQIEYTFFLKMGLVCPPKPCCLRS